MEINTFYILSCCFALFTLIFTFSYPLYAVRYPLYKLLSSVICLLSSTLVEGALQIHPFLTNKANFQKSQVNLTNAITREYEQMDTWSRGKNKAKTKPIQTQFKANTNPIQTQFKAKQTQFIVSLPNQFHTILACFSSRPKNAALRLFTVGFVRTRLCYLRMYMKNAVYKIILEMYPIIWYDNDLQ